MLTNKFTSIASFVAKLAYKHVICNTYIPRVYIKMPAIDFTAEIACEKCHRRGTQNPHAQWLVNS